MLLFRMEHSQHWDASGLVSVLFDIVTNALEEAENSEIFMITNYIKFYQVVKCFIT